jgi:APA family basic amino acid/polyamine antiporter
VSRIITGVARDHLIPPFISRVSGRFATPWIALLLQGVVSALIGLFTDFADLAEMVSISTLFAFWLVALGLMWRRHYIHRQTPAKRGVLLAFLLLMIVSSSITFTVLWRMIDVDTKWYGLVICIVALILFTVMLHLLVPQDYVPLKFKVPLYPYLPAFSILINTFLMGQLKVISYERFGIWCLACLGVYLLYGMHASYTKSRRDAALPLKAGGEVQSVSEQEVAKVAGS